LKRSGFGSDLTWVKLRVQVSKHNKATTASSRPLARALQAKRDSKAAEKPLTKVGTQETSHLTKQIVPTAQATFLLGWCSLQRRLKIGVVLPAKLEYNQTGVCTPNQAFLRSSLRAAAHLRALGRFSHIAKGLGSRFGEVFFPF